MNRKINFRGWHKEQRKMYFNDEIVIYNGEGFKEITSFDSDAIHVEDYFLVLMQFTGLHDKNGKEIYEGDIIQNQWGRSGSVYFKNGTFRIETQGPLHNYLVDSKAEVIANIHENPELLEVEE